MNGAKNIQGTSVNSESTSFNLAPPVTSTGTRPSQPARLPLQLGAWPHRLLEALLDPRLVAYPGPPRSQEQVAPPSGQTLGSAVSRRGSLSLALGAAASFCSVLHTCCVNMDLVSVGGLAQAPTCTGTWGTRCVLAAACQHLPPSWSRLLTGTQFSPAAGDAAGGGTVWWGRGRLVAGPDHSPDRTVSRRFCPILIARRFFKSGHWLPGLWLPHLLA